MTETANNFYLSISILLGILISQGLGYWLTPKYLKWIQNDYMKASDYSYDPPKWGALDWLIGVNERLFFTVIVAFDVSGAAVAMITWLLVKMATNWHRFVESQKRDPKVRGLAFCSLSAGIVSLTFALVGGLLIRYGIDRIKI